MIRTILLSFCAVLLMSGAAFAEEKPKADTAKPAAQSAQKGALQPDLRKILEDQAKKESQAWGVSNKYYAEQCIKGVEKGKDVPPEMAVASTDCYIGAIDKNVKPVALNTHMVDDMTAEWKTLARKYAAKQITHKEWMTGMQATQKKFAQARLGVIKGLVDQAKKQQDAAKAAAPAKKATQ